jgi:plasmid stabilization system protein ParE
VRTHGLWQQTGTSGCDETSGYAPRIPCQSAERSPVAALRMRKAIEKAARSLVATPLALPGRPGAVAGTREIVDGHRTPFTLVFVRTASNGDCVIYRCIHHSHQYPENSD